MIKFSLGVQEARRLNLMLGKGYKLVTEEELRKKLQPRKKKMTIGIVPTEVTHKQSNKGKDSPYEPPKNINNLFQPPIHKTPYNHQTKFDFTDIFNSPINTGNKENPPSDNAIKPQSFTKYQSILQKIREHPKSSIITSIEPPFLQYKNTFNSLLQKADNNDYFTLAQLATDIDRIFLKCYSIYTKYSEEYVSTQELQHFFKKIIEEEKESEPFIQPSSTTNFFQNLPNIIRQNSIQPNLSAPNLKKKQTSVRQNIAIMGNITIYEKRLLGQSIKKLPSQYLAGVCRIVSETRQNRDEYQFDIDNLPNKKVRELQAYVKDCMMGDQKSFIQTKLIRNQEQSDQQSLFVITSDGQN